MELARQGVGLPVSADPELREAQINQFFTQFDTNHDGRIQKSEWLEFFGTMFDVAIERGLGGQ